MGVTVEIGGVREEKVEVVDSVGIGVTVVIRGVVCVMCEGVCVTVVEIGGVREEKVEVVC